MKVAVVGATGMVGRIMLEVLKSRKFPIDELLPVASEKSEGSLVEYNNKNYKVIGLQEGVDSKPDLAIFSAGGDISKIWAPKFSEKGCIVIDNSSAWRMDPEKKLIIPEINGDLLTVNDKIIANPNCSTIQLLMVLSPLHKKFKIKRVIVSTYQSITGTGVKAVKQLENERNCIDGEKAYLYEIDKNCIPQCDIFMENDYTKEEMKLTNETKKILDSSINVSATAVRVPIVGGHSESVNIEFENDFSIEEIKSILSSTYGVVLMDDPSKNVYPMPKYCEGKDEVFVGRIRKDESHSKAINLWIVADNLRKGAATNAIQIAEVLLNKNILSLKKVLN